MFVAQRVRCRWRVRGLVRGWAPLGRSVVRLESALHDESAYLRNRVVSDSFFAARIRTDRGREPLDVRKSPD